MAIFKAAVEGPDGSPCLSPKGHQFPYSESPPTCMTVTEWVQAQKADPAISQITTWIEDGKCSAVKVSE